MWPDKREATERPGGITTLAKGHHSRAPVLARLPISLGIAIASGTPPVAGLVSAIIAGLIYPFLADSFKTISGPVAGLAPVLFVAMTAQDW